MHDLTTLKVKKNDLWIKNDLAVWSLSEFTGQVIKSSVVFNPLDQSSIASDSVEDAELKGPVVSYFKKQ